jgi:nucleoid DNA-binding protein
MLDLLSINKTGFIRYISSQIDLAWQRLHVIAVVGILFDELRKDLIAGKTIKIRNFGNWYIGKSLPKRHWNGEKVVQLRNGRKDFYWKLPIRLSRFIRKHMDIPATLALEPYTKRRPKFRWKPWSKMGIRITKLQKFREMKKRGLISV